MISILPMIGSHGGRSCSCFALASVMLVSFASACPGRPTVGDDGDQGTSTSSSTGSSTTSGAMLTDTSDMDGTSGTSEGTTDTAGTADSGSSDTGPLVCERFEPVANIPAILEVTVEVLNDTAEPVYMLLESFSGCTEYALARDGRSLPIVFGISCPCECGPLEPDVYPVALEPGQSLVLTWDGRVLVFYTESVLCEWKGKDPWCETSTTSARQPLAPGPITMTIPIYDEEGFYDQSQVETLELPRCESPRSFSVDFELGSEDLTVPVALSEVVIR